MDYIEINSKLYEYYLFENDSRTEIVYTLSLKEAKIKNYAFALNRTRKRLVLKTEVNDKETTIIVLPKGN
jgi:hypothetical protein